MRRFLLCLLAAGMLTGGIRRETFQKGDVVGFFGDSITHAEYSEINYTHVLYNYYVTHLPKEEMEFRNLGVGGAKLSDGLELYQEDPASSGLQKAVLEYGINDLKKYLYEETGVYEGSEGERKENIEDFEENLGAFVNLLEEDGIEKEGVYIASLPVPSRVNSGTGTESDPALLRTREGFRLMSEAARGFAQEEGLPLIEFQEPLTELAETFSGADPERNLLCEDYLHPDTNGQIYLAYLFLEQQGALEDVSYVKILEGRIESENAKVSNLHCKEGCLYYDYRADRLPMGISHEYRQADESLHILDKLNREIIQVQDLEAEAVYDIYINGEQVGSYTGAEFAEGVNIANVSENPSQRFARAVEQMNRGRRVEELAYRKKVQDFTDCGSGRVTKEELLEAYKVWREKDEEYRKNMYELVQGQIEVTQRVAVVRQGAEAPEAAFAVPGRDYKKIILPVLFLFAAAAAVFCGVRKKRKQR